jgi:galactokinase/mevalonate kinase-like predicted kinase
MMHQHKDLAKGKWKKLSFAEQMANIGSEIERTISWKRKGHREISNRAFERALELLDLTIADPKNRPRLKELIRVREAVSDHFFFNNDYRSSPESWQRYFGSFLIAARRNR